MLDSEMEQRIIEISEGDKTALEKLYQAYRHVVFSLARTILSSESTAEDVAQEVFLKIWASAHTYRIGANPKAWIMGITRNAAIDAMRKTKYEMSTDEVFETDFRSQPSLEETVVNAMTLSEALHTLASDAREIVILRSLAGLTVSEVSKLTQTPLNTVYWKYHRAIKSLKLLIGKGVL